MAPPLLPDTIDAIAERVAAGEAGPVIASALNMTRSAISGVIFRLRKAGDPRVPAAGASPIVSRPEQRDALADAFANGAADLATAERLAGLSLPIAKLRWAEIRAGLGRQAR